MLIADAIVRAVADEGFVRLFWSKVDRGAVAECWEWTAARTSTGYGEIGVGRFCVPRVWCRMAKASRVSWTIENGRIPDGLFICHHCDNRACVNPRHLFVGTQRDNMRDCSKKGRVGVRRGSSNPASVLTEEQVRLIRARVSAGESIRSVGRLFGVSDTAVCDIANRKRWAHVP